MPPINLYDPKESSSAPPSREEINDKPTNKGIAAISHSALLRKVLRNTRKSTPNRPLFCDSRELLPFNQRISEEQLQIMLKDCQSLQNVDIVARQLKSLFELTSSEALVAAYYAKGIAVEEIVSQTSFTIATVRTHIRNTFKKLNISRQTQLTVLVKTRLMV